MALDAPAAKHCKECGNPLPVTPNCPECDSDLIPNRGIHRSRCGARLPEELAVPREVAFCIQLNVAANLTEERKESIKRAMLRLRHGRNLRQSIGTIHGRKTRLLLVHMNVRDERIASTLTQVNEFQQALQDAEDETDHKVGRIIDNPRDLAFAREAVGFRETQTETGGKATPRKPAAPTSTTPTRKSFRSTIKENGKTLERLAQQLINWHIGVADRLDEFVGRLVYVTCPRCLTTCHVPPSERFCRKCGTRLR
jgi:hypothetical protein